MFALEKSKAEQQEPQPRAAKIIKVGNGHGVLLHASDLRFLSLKAGESAELTLCEGENGEAFLTLKGRADAVAVG